MSRPPVVTVTLILALCGVFALELQTGDAAVMDWAFVPAQASVETALSSLFLHDPTAPLSHLGANLVFLAVFGTVVESALGSLVFGGLYLTAGLAGALTHLACNPGSTTPLVGASGCLFGLLAVAGVLRPRLLGFVVWYAGYTLWQLFSGTGGSTSAAAHVGGFIAGAVAAVVLRVCNSEALEAT